MLTSKLSSEMTLLLSGKRMSLNHAAPLLSLVLPWVLFCVMYSCVSFSIHYENPTLCKCLCALGLIPSLMIGLISFKGWVGKTETEPNWWNFMFFTSLAAWFCAVILGDLNFRAYGQPYFQYRDMRSYRNVDPATTKGRQLLDASMVHFVDGTHIEAQQHASFTNLNQFCVAPIENNVMTQMDLWAVGLNCCPNGEWKCPSFTDEDETLNAMRLLADDQEPYYKLAVEGAKSRHKLKVEHPVFFYWVRDASTEIERIREDGYKFYAIGMIAHFGWQGLCTLLALSHFRKYAYRPPL